MVYRGRVKNGMVLLDEPAQLPEGAAVRVTLDEQQAESPISATPTKPIHEEIADIVAGVPPEEWAILPEDLSSQLDHYVYGIPMR